MHRMDRRMTVPFLVAILVLWGCAYMGAGRLEDRYGKNRPTITHSFAAKEMRVGDVWKVYLKASDPDGDLSYIVATIDQPGKGGAYPPSYIRIKDPKDLSGYIFFNTDVNIQQGLLYTNLTLTVAVKDKAGHFSDPVSFPLHFRNIGRQEPPPAGVFQEKELGPIMIQIQPLGDDGNIGT
jgi:hypothetical protein